MHDPNENRPGYKRTKVGWIPDDWGDAPLSGVVDPRRPICYGVVQTGDPVPNGVPCVRVMDLVQAQLDPKKMITTSTAIHQQYRRTILKRGDVMVALRGEVGKAVIVPEYLEGTNLTRGVALLSKSASVSLEFLAAVLNGPYERVLLRRNINGTALQEIPIEALRKVPIPLPPLPEQQKIADVLSTWDDAIEQTRDLIAAKKQQKKALMQQLLTGKRRLPGFCDKVTHQRLKHHVVERNQRCGCQTRLPVLSVTNDRGFVGQDDQFGRRVASKDVSNYKVVAKGEFAYNPSRVNVGSLDLLRDRDAGLLSPMYVVFAVDAPTLDATYFRHFCNTYSFAEQVRHLTQGSVRDSLSFDGLCAVRCAIPSLTEQQAITKVLNTADTEIKSLQEHLAALQQQKKGLMQRLLTGQVRVKV